MTTQSLLIAFGAMASACLALWMVRLNRADGQSSPVTSAE